MKTETLLIIAVGAAAIYFLARPGGVRAAPGTRPATSSPAPGTTAQSRIERAAIDAGNRLADKAGKATSDWIDSWFAERPSVGGSNPGLDESYL